MKVKGDTNNRNGTMALRKQINDHPRITLASERMSQGAGGREVFDISLEPKKSEKRR
jgi:hypothetical protein